MGKYSGYYIEWDEYFVPIKLYKEWRSTIRFSIGRKEAILRVPFTLTKSAINKQLFKMQLWLKKHFDHDETTANRFILRTYVSGQQIKIRSEVFTLQISMESRKTNSAKLLGSIIQIRLRENLDSYEKSKSIQHLISRVLNKYFLNDVKERVAHWNNMFFHKTINSVKLKYNQSNWGSCSSKSNINLSSRLLLAPLEIMDYVIVHELAHLIEMNHSSRFWDKVKEAMPDYKMKELWLKRNGHLLKF